MARKTAQGHTLSAEVGCPAVPDLRHLASTHPRRPSVFPHGVSLGESSSTHSLDLVAEFSIPVTTKMFHHPTLPLTLLLHHTAFLRITDQDQIRGQGLNSSSATCHLSSELSLSLRKMIYLVNYLPSSIGIGWSSVVAYTKYLEKGNCCLIDFKHCQMQLLPWHDVCH